VEESVNLIDKNQHPLVEKAATFVAALFKNELSNKYVYHNFNHTRETVEAATAAAAYYQFNETDIYRLLLAAWFHDAGYTKTYAGHEEVSQKIAREFLAEEQADEENIQAVEDLIASTQSGHEPQNLLEEIMHDADRVSIGKKRFFRKAELLRIEWEVFLDKHYTEKQWAQEQLQFIITNNFYTEYFRREFGSRREKNIEKQRSKLDKTKKKREKDLSPKRGTETMYRATYRNHINLSSIADSKANMMISINTIIMSVIITVVGGGFTLSETAFVENLRYTVPICILLLGALASVIFAIISARPNVTEKEVNLEKIRKKKSSVLFFGNFSNMKLPDFITNMSELRQSKEMLYDNMTVDIYYLGLVLTQKYRFLRISYNIFMGALILAVVAFLGIFIYSQFYR
jgi:HD superfamily phosphodiesterase